MAKAEIVCEILEDGTIKFTTDKIPDEQHVAADAFLADVTANSGGERKTEQRRAGHVHTHTHGGHEHTHQ